MTWDLAKYMFCVEQSNWKKKPSNWACPCTRKEGFRDPSHFLDIPFSITLSKIPFAEYSFTKYHSPSHYLDPFPITLSLYTLLLSHCPASPSSITLSTLTSSFKDDKIGVLHYRKTRKPHVFRLQCDILYLMFHLYKGDLYSYFLGVSHQLICFLIYLSFIFLSFS